MTFPYIEFLGLSQERVFRPMVPIIFEYGELKIDAYALIDSAADYTILPIETASEFNIPLSKQHPYRLQAAGGNVVTMYKSPEKINLRIQESGFKDISLQSTVYFAESETKIILGQKGFLEFLNISLSGKQRELKIKT